MEEAKPQLVMKLVPSSKETLLICTQRGHDRSDIINAGLIALGRMGQRDQDKIISSVKDMRTTPAPETQV